MSDPGLEEAIKYKGRIIRKSRMISCAIDLVRCNIACSVQLSPQKAIGRALVDNGVNGVDSVTRRAAALVASTE